MLRGGQDIKTETLKPSWAAQLDPVSKKEKRKKKTIISDKGIKRFVRAAKPNL